MTSCRGCQVRNSRFRDAFLSSSQNTDGVTISGNTFHGGGITFTEVNRILLVDNRFEGARVRFTVSNVITVRRNVVTGAPVGFQADNGFGSGGFQFDHNVFAANGVGLYLIGPLGGNIEVDHNVFSRNGAAGLLVAGFALGEPTVISANLFRANGFNPQGMVDSAGSAVNDGLHIDPVAGRGATVADNQTVRNADFGIEAPATVTDGGGNTSTGDPSGCSGVLCS